MFTLTKHCRLLTATTRLDRHVVDLIICNFNDIGIDIDIVVNQCDPRSLLTLPHPTAI